MSKKGPRATKEKWQEWWRLKNEEGLTEPEIARKFRLDTRTVKRGIRQLGAAGDERQVRVELKKEAYAKHVDELLDFVGKLRKQADGEAVPDLAPTRAVFQPQGRWLRPPGMKLAWPEGNSAKVVLPAEDTPEWLMLRSHVKTPGVWVAIEDWKQAAAKLAGVERSTAESLVSWLKAVTGLTVLAHESPDPHASLSGADELYARALGDASGGDRRLGNSEELLKLDGSVIRVGGQALVEGLDAATAEAMLKKLGLAMRELPAELKLVSLSAAFQEYREAAARVATELRFLQAAHYLAGNCRGCKVLTT